MSNLPPEHRPDDDPTEELPVLSAALLGLAADEQREAAEQSVVQTGQLVDAVEAEQLSDAFEAKQLSDGGETALIRAQIDEAVFDADPHEATVVLLNGWSDLDADWSGAEDEGSQWEAENVRLREQLEAACSENRERRDSEERLVTRLAQRNSQLAELLEQLHLARQQIVKLEQRLHARDRREAELQAALDRGERQLAKWRQLAIAAAPRPDRLRMDARGGGVTESIVKVLSWWQDMLARITRYRARVFGLVLRGPQPRNPPSAPQPRSTPRQ